MKANAHAVRAAATALASFAAAAALQVSGVQSEAFTWAFGVVAFLAAVVAGVMWWKGRSASLEEKMGKVGDESVVYGDVPEDVGNRSTVIRPMPGETNLILNKGGLAMGYGARADSTSIAIGAYANAGDTKKSTE
jgi:hypothetical protein